MQLEWHGRFPLTEEKVRELVDESGGNYIILVKLKDDSYRPIYVGKTENLQERFLQHLCKKEPNPCLKEHVEKYTLGMRFCYVESERDRKNVEHTLYHHYKHECNEKEPEGSIIDINFPF